MNEQERFLRDTPCETAEELDQWLQHYLGVFLPNCIVDKEYSNCSPFHMVWWMYDSALRTQAITNALFIGNRDGGKTFGAAVLEFLLLQHDHRSVTHIGAIEKQAKRAYTYFQDFYRHENFREFVDRMVMERTIVNNRGTFEILPCTLASVNGPHTPLVVRDEIDTVQDMQAYADIKGIARQMNDKRPPIEVGISTRKSAFGLVQQEVEAAPKTGMQVFTWGILECCERCPDSRSGTKDLPLYVNIDELSTITEDEWKNLPHKIRYSYTQYMGYEGCIKNCKMFAACRGHLKNQTCTSPFLRTIDRVQKQVFESTEDWTLAQHMSIKPSPAGLVYGNFRKERSVKTYREMIEIFLGEEIKTDREVTVEDLVTIFEGSGLTAVVGIDFGFTNPTVCTLMYIDDVDNIFLVDEFAITQMDGGELAHWLKENWMPKYKIECIYPDIESPANIKLLRKAGFPCAGAQKDPDAVGSRGATIVNKDVKGGIESVRRFIKVPGTNKTKFFVNKKCVQGLGEVTKYHYKTDRSGNVTADDPAKKFDHAMDSWRYPIHSIFGHKNPEIAMDIDQGINLGETLNEAPTIERLTQSLGLQFNDNEEEYEEAKKRANKQKVKREHLGIELEDQEDEDNNEDGFSFTF